MPTCNGCGDVFPALSEGVDCGKCSKLATAMSDTERDVIALQPQCVGCGCVYPHLKSELCGACIQMSANNPAIFSGRPVLASIVQNIATTHQAEASKHRLNQNPNLKKVADLKKRTAQIHQTINSPVKPILTRTTVCEFSPTGAKAKPVQMPLVHSEHETSVKLNDALDKILIDVNALYCNLPGDVHESLTRNCVRFSVHFNHNDVAIPNTSYEDTIASFFRDFVVRRKLVSEKDEKLYTFGLRVAIYLVEIAKRKRQEDDDYDDEGLPPTSRRPRRSQSISATSATTGSARYQSRFQPPSAAQSIQAGIQYHTFMIVRTTVAVDDSGTVTLTELEDEVPIDIASGWASDTGAWKREAGYLGHGMGKIAVKGRFAGVDYAILQDRPYGSCFSTREDLTKNMSSELKLLALGQFFLTSFYKRAELQGVALPKIRFNSDGAFVGYARVWGDDTSRAALVRPLFLATKLLRTGELYPEIRFSGTDEAGQNMDALGQVIDTFAHHTLEDSFGYCVFVDLQGILDGMGQLCLIDPQAHTDDQSSGKWDHGSVGIEQFKAQHICRRTCKELGLPVLLAKKGGLKVRQLLG